jgi:hypothetical protein
MHLRIPSERVGNEGAAPARRIPFCMCGNDEVRRALRKMIASLRDFHFMATWRPRHLLTRQLLRAWWV